MSTTIVYPDFIAFLRRVDKTLNGIDPTTAFHFPESIRSTGNVACWNAINSLGCIGCIDICDSHNSVACMDCVRVNNSTHCSDARDLESCANCHDCKELTHEFNVNNE